jgi:hypothetical protein
MDTSLGAVTTLQEFLTTAGRLTIEERRLIVDQALVLIEQFYVHLPLKRAMHAVDPVQRLKLLRHRLDTIPEERRFHDEMISTFTSLRDLHTRYMLPAPFESTTANLPLRIEEFFEDGERRYLVTEVTPGVIDDPRFERGVVITHWNGIPMNRAVPPDGKTTGSGRSWERKRAREQAAPTFGPTSCSGSTYPERNPPSGLCQKGARCALRSGDPPGSAHGRVNRSRIWGSSPTQTRSTACPATTCSTTTRT